MKDAKPAPSASTHQFERLLDSDEAASLLKIHPKTLQRMARNHEITGIQIGKLWRLLAFLLHERVTSKKVKGVREGGTEILEKKHAGASKLPDRRATTV